MKILLTGDVQFGRDYWDVIKDCPTDLFKNMIPIFSNADLIIFNLETVLSNKNIIENEDKVNGKPYHILSIPSQLQYLRTITNKPIIVATINNHTFDYGLKGYYNTLKILENTYFLFTYGYKYLDYNNIIFFDATTHWTEFNRLKEKNEHINKLWKDNCWFIDINDYKSINYASKIITVTRKNNPNKIIIIAIHWGKNWVNNMGADFMKARSTLHNAVHPTTRMLVMLFAISLCILICMCSSHEHNDAFVGAYMGATLFGGGGGGAYNGGNMVWTYDD